MPNRKASPSQNPGDPPLSQKRRPGRPPTLKAESKRKRRNISVSDEAWIGLERLSENLDYPSRSDFIENIGVGMVEISKSIKASERSPLHEILIYRRLIGVVLTHHEVLWSLAAFHFAQYEKLPRLREQYASVDELIVNNVLTAISIIFQYGYIRPDRYINSLSSHIRLLCYCLIIDQAGLANSWDEFEGDPVERTFDDITESSKGQLEDQLARLRYTMTYLSSSSFSPTFTALRLKYIGGFTESQIQQIYALQGRPFTIEKIRQLMHEGWSLFRKHRSKGADLTRPSEPVAIPSWALVYAHLLESPSLVDQDKRYPLLSIILKSTYHVPINLWLCEIEHIWSLEHFENEKDIKDRLAVYQREIHNNIDQRLIARKEEIDTNMHYVRSRAMAMSRLTDFFEKETRISSNTKLGKFMMNLLKGEEESQFSDRVLRTLHLIHKKDQA